MIDLCDYIEAVAHRMREKQASGDRKEFCRLMGMLASVLQEKQVALLKELQEGSSNGRAGLH